MLEVMAGKDDRDQTTRPEKVDDYTKLTGKIKGFKLGVPKEYFEGVDSKVASTIWKSIKRLESLGARYEMFSLKTTKSMSSL